MKSNFKKASKYTMWIIPTFVLMGCSDSDEQIDKGVSVNSEYVQTIDNNFSIPTEILNSYEQAKNNGYSGTLDEWITLLDMYKTNPTEAQKVAEQSGYDGGDVLLGALVGAIGGALIANAMSSKNNMASNSYSAQRANNNTNYAYSQPNNQQDKDKRNVGSSYVGSTTTANNTSSSFVNSTKPTTTTTTPSTTSSSSMGTTSKGSFTSVSRGGFGSSVSASSSSGG